jgi:hypothetical protein
MKTTIEINGYEIVIEEIDGVISVSAVKDDEVIEEFEIQSGEESQSEDDSEESQDFEGDEVQDFKEFGSDDDESQDEFEESDDDESQDEFEESDEDESQDEEEGRALESFNSFLKKRK